ncbi:hypothetical protein niasHT_035264 [Heterodera trifolii]|uniref:Uncharacterized protein n=1 Tax=Heterodera trifolii TaxID=157864 RepID=A0ABD2J3L5_9BILA
MIVHRFSLSPPIMMVSSPNFHAMTMPMLPMDKRWPNGFSLPVLTVCQRIEDFKAEFATASSPVNFIVVIRFPPTFNEFVLLFDLINELTQEQTTLKQMIEMGRFLLIRCPIERDANKWKKWEKEAIGWLLDATLGPSDQPKK